MFDFRIGDEVIYDGNEPVTIVGTGLTYDYETGEPIPVIFISTYLGIMKLRGNDIYGLEPKSLGS